MRLAQYHGRMVNHVETLYRTGERELAIEFAQTLGCTVVDTDTPVETGSTILYAYPDPEEQDRLNNVVYMSEIRREQQDLENALGPLLRGDGAAAKAYEAYLHRALNHPHGVPHFGIRYPSFESLEQTLEALGERIEGDFKDRVRFSQIVRPGHSSSMTSELIQAFVFTDIIVSGLFSIGQLIELQAQNLQAG
jgi:hypothetical protein